MVGGDGFKLELGMSKKGYNSIEEELMSHEGAPKIRGSRKVESGGREVEPRD